MIDLLNTTTSGSLLPYCILGLAAFVEGPITILVAGAGIAIGQFLPFPVYLALVIGNLSADMCWYNLGRFGKLKWIERAIMKFGGDALDVERLQENIRKYAPRLLFLSKLTVGLPIPTLITVGLNRVAVRRWIVSLILGELIKSAVLLTVGYLSATSIQQIFGSVRMVLWVITALLVVVIVIFIKRQIKEKQFYL